MTDASERVAADLERVAAEHGDITDAVYNHFFARSASGEALMGHADQPMRGRMLQQTLDLFVDNTHLEPGAYLDWELDNHLIGYRATPAMYAAFLDAVVAVAAQGADSAVRQAWADRQAAIMRRVLAFDEQRPAP